VLLGVGVGLLGAAAMSRLLPSVLPSLEFSSGLGGAAAIVVLLTVALAACYHAARRATQVVPTVARRDE
jgi:putative ABC transport system permease protein